jgi:hypothetical protein
MLLYTDIVNQWCTQMLVSLVRMRAYIHTHTCMRRMLPLHLRENTFTIFNVATSPLSFRRLICFGVFSVMADNSVLAILTL